MRLKKTRPQDAARNVSVRCFQSVHKRDWHRRVLPIGDRRRDRAVQRPLHRLWGHRLMRLCLFRQLRNEVQRFKHLEYGTGNIVYVHRCGHRHQPRDLVPDQVGREMAARTLIPAPATKSSKERTWKRKKTSHEYPHNKETIKNTK